MAMASWGCRFALLVLSCVTCHVNAEVLPTMSSVSSTSDILPSSKLPLLQVELADSLKAELEDDVLLSSTGKPVLTFPKPQKVAMRIKNVLEQFHASVEGGAYENGAQLFGDSVKIMPPFAPTMYLSSTSEKADMIQALTSANVAVKIVLEEVLVSHAKFVKGDKKRATVRTTYTIMDATSGEVKDTGDGVSFWQEWKGKTPKTSSSSSGDEEGKLQVGSDDGYEAYDADDSYDESYYDQASGKGGRPWALLWAIWNTDQPVEKDCPPPPPPAPADLPPCPFIKHLGIRVC
eukprot:TRINITY_DN266_c0_g1_i1.p1 TRINITY_DN266_c0_g1~~TRINITY_DN266_c0_g1_i1.p1  ORF type:complete len:291 (-),score=76.33 TRINITY_DN266_c0_g1_i1:413-1285(-)